MSGGSIKSRNGVTAEQALSDYWNTGSKSNKKEIARVLGQKGQYASEEKYANRYADEREKSNQKVIDNYKQNPNAWKSDYDYVTRTQKSRSEYVEEGRQTYKNLQDNTLNMASADVAKRMGYNISGAGGSTASALNNVMGKSNADKLRELVRSSAKNR